jgi:hypothetical protein
VDLAVSFEHLCDDTYGVPNESTWFVLVTFLREVLDEHSVIRQHYDISAERFDPFVVECTITKRGAVTRTTAISVCEKLKEKLKECGDGWMFRFQLCDMEDQESEMVIWLEVDRFRVNEYVGRVFVDRCRTMDEFDQRFL